jgi:hypothetical protein
LRWRAHRVMREPEAAVNRPRAMNVAAVR